MTTDSLRAARVHAPPRRGRQLLIDLGLGVRLAVRSGRTGGLRLILTAVGVGLCVAVLLLGASLDRAQETRQARSEALNPMTLAQEGAAPGAELFLAVPYQQTYHGRLIVGTDLSPRGPTATPPPGVPTFPAAGTIVMSPALRDLLDSPDGDLLRPRFTEPVVGIIGDAGLTSPSDLRFYRGVATPAGTFDRDPVNADLVAWGWGAQSFRNDPVYGELIRLAVAVGAAVVLVPLLIFVSLMSRLGAATRDRRTAALRTIGATGGQLRRILAGETLVGALAGVVVGVLGFLVIRHAAWLRIGGDGFFATDISPSPSLTVAVVLGVPAIATASVLVGSNFVTMDRRSGLRVATGGRLLLAVLVAVLVGGQIAAGGLNRFGSAAPGLIAVTVLLTLVLIPALLAPLLSVITTLIPHRRLTWLLAARRIRADVATSARAVAGMSVVVAAGVTMVVMLSLTATTSANGHHADKDPTEYQVQVDGATSGELTEVISGVRDVPGVGTIVGGSYVWMTARPSDGGFEVLIAGCEQLTALGVDGCEEGDVFRVPQFGAALGGTPGDTLRLRWGTATSDPSWTLPPTVRDLPAPVGMTMFAPFLIATPAALGADLDGFLAGSFASFTVDTDRPDALDDLRNAVGTFGSRAAVTSPTEWAADSGRAQLTSTLQTGLILGGGLTLAVALAGLLVVAIEQLVGRRRALTLTVAAGVPRSTVARSILAGAVLTGTTGAVLGTGVGLLLAYYVSSILFTSVSLGVLPVIGIAAAAVSATVVVTAATLPALARLTRLDSLRTE